MKNSKSAKAAPAPAKTSPQIGKKSSATAGKATKAVRGEADKYNDPSHNYLHYWDGREYEDAAERMAIKRLFAGKHFRHAVDIGGGYGRLCVFLEKYADKVTLTDPSQQQLDIAKDYLKDHPEIDRKLMQAADIKFPDGSIDLITVVRIFHHIPDPNAEFKEIARVLSDDGYFLMEFANSMHARNRLKYALKRSKIPKEPIDIRTKKSAKELPFVNHNPHTVMKQLGQAGLKVERVLSVSNLRSPGVKKFMPRSLMLAIESVMQSTLASTFFGPSIFFLVKKGK